MAQQNLSYFDGLDYFALLLDSFEDETVPTSSYLNEGSDDASKEDKLVVGNKRKRPKKFIFVPKPRLLKTDIRRSYPEIFAKVMNSGDFALQYKFLHTFLPPSFELESYTIEPFTNRLKIVRLMGTPLIAKFYYCAFAGCGPDSTITINDVNVLLSSDTTKCKIICSFTYKCTKVYDIADDECGLGDIIFDSDLKNNEQYRSIIGCPTSYTATTDKKQNNNDITCCQNTISAQNTFVKDVNTDDITQKGDDNYCRSTSIQKEDNKSLLFWDKKEVEVLHKIPPNNTITVQSLKNDLTKHEIDQMAGEIEALSLTLPLTTKPSEIVINSTVIFYTDENKYITRMATEFNRSNDD